MGPKKTKKKIAGELGCHDISKDLSRTKPKPVNHYLKPARTVPPVDIAFPKQEDDAELLLDALIAFETQMDEGVEYGRPLGLSDRYLAAYANDRKPGARVVPTMDPELTNNEPSVTEHVAPHHVGSAFNESSRDIETYDQHDTWNEIGGPSSPDIILPPSGQGNNVAGLGNDIPRTLPPESLEVANRFLNHSFDSDGLFPDTVEVDEFPMDDEDMERLIQAIAPPSEQHGPENGWRPQNVSDGFMSDDEIREEALEQLADTTSRSAFVTLSNENLTMPRRDIEKTLYSSLPDSHSSCIPTDVSGNAGKSNSGSLQTLEGSENFFDDDGLDAGLLDLNVGGFDPIVQQSTPLTSPQQPSTPKLQWMPPKVYTPAKSLQTPVPSIDVPHLVPCNVNGQALSFMRPPFPAPIRDRSPILGLNNRTVLRTCFRIGEALNAAAAAARTNTDAIVELYARVVGSEREVSGGFKQFFQFGDLFTDKPPYLSATYSLWKSVPLWDVDSRVFVGEAGKGKMARVVGRIKKEVKGVGREMIVLSIWEVDWEDVRVAKGIVCS